MGDYDEDGWPDLYVACDSTPAILYHNNHNGTFTDIAGDAGVAFNEDGREQAGMGSSAADYNGDGHIDRPMLLVNEAKKTNHWLGLQLRGVQSNRDAIGARVVLHSAARSWVDEVRSGSSYSSSSDLRLHFGLGASPALTSVEVRWAQWGARALRCARARSHRGAYRR